MKRQISIFLHLFLLLALSVCGSIAGHAAATRPSRLPDQSWVKTLPVQVVDEEKR